MCVCTPGESWPRAAFRYSYSGYYKTEYRIVAGVKTKRAVSIIHREREKIVDLIKSVIIFSPIKIIF